MRIIKLKKLMDSYLQGNLKMIFSQATTVVEKNTLLNLL